MDKDEADPLTQALHLQGVAAKAGFDWTDINGVLDKIAEELHEVAEEVKADGGPARLRHELGDLLFACLNLARHLDLDPKQALAECNARFTRRFARVVDLAAEQGVSLRACTPQLREHYWNEAKSREDD